MAPPATITVRSYEDKGVDGSFTAGDPYVNGWTVFIDANGNGQLDGTETSAVTAGSGATLGTATFQVPPGTYSVCEVRQTGWFNTDPGGSTPCESTGALASQGASTLDFGNVATISPPNCPPPTPFGVTGQYEIMLASCKDNQFVFAYSDAEGNKLASLQPVSAGVKVPDVEKITWSFTGNSQNTLTVVYDDDPAGGYGDVTRVMKYCKLDPRDPLSSTYPDFTLKSPYDLYSNSNLVLPTGETSCLISTTESADTSTGGKFVAYVYSALDGWRSTT